MSLIKIDPTKLPQTPEPQPITTFSSLTYLERFTEAEQLAVVTATLTDPAVKLFYDKLLAADFVDIEDPRVAMGLDLLVSKELIAPERKNELLAPELP